jgi:hypothetical protein
MRPEYIIIKMKNGMSGASELGYFLRSPFLLHLDKFFLIRIPRWKKLQHADASYSFNVFPPPIRKFKLRFDRV